MALAPGLKRRGGLFGASVQQPMPPEMTATANPMAPAKPKFFGEGGVGRAIAGNIGDFLLQNSGMNPIYQPAMQQRQAMAYDEQQYQRRRRDTLADWQARQDYEATHLAPPLRIIGKPTMVRSGWLAPTVVRRSSTRTKPRKSNG